MQSRAAAGWRAAQPVLALAGIAVVALVAGCAADGPLPIGPSASSSASTSSAPTSPTPVGLPASPANAVTLAAMGFRHGPVDAFFLPADSVLITRADQPNVVVLVLSAPPARQLADFLRQTLPAAGYDITADRPEAAVLTFAGRGWTGSFTGSATSSALVLRPR